MGRGMETWLAKESTLYYAKSCDEHWLIPVEINAVAQRSAVNNVLHIRGLVRHNDRTKCEFLRETKEIAKLAHNA
jgi:hypothetical protein